MAEDAEFRERPWPCKLRCALLDGVAEPASASENATVCPWIVGLDARRFVCHYYYYLVVQAVPLVNLTARTLSKLPFVLTRIFFAWHVAQNRVITISNSVPPLLKITLPYG